MVQERAVLTGGFLGYAGPVIRRLPGVVATRLGYTRGDVSNATSSCLPHSRINPADS